MFLFLIQNIDCGYSFKPSRRGGSNMYTQSMFQKPVFLRRGLYNRCCQQLREVRYTFDIEYSVKYSFSKANQFTVV